jgi:uncharacterized protein involved in exopolysaccharide biosynthesis
MEDEDDDEQSGGGVPTELLLSYLAFGREALKKRVVLATTVFVMVSGFAVALASLWPRTYHADTRLMAQRSDVLAMRGDSIGDALRGAQDVILSRENLQKIVDSRNLVRAWEERRAPILRLKDKIANALRGPISPSEQAEALVGLLKDKLTVTVGPGDGTLSLAVDWADGQSAASIVDAAEQNFLATRHSAEISMIADYAAILEGHAADARKDVDSLAEQVKQSRKSRIAAAKDAFKADRDKDADKEPTTVLATPHYAPSRPTRPDDDQDVARIKSQLDTKQRTYSDMEDDRRHQLVEAQAKLSDLLTKYTEAHPAIVDQKQRILMLQRESAQAVALKSEIVELQESMKSHMSASQSAAGVGSAVLLRPGARTGDPETLPPELTELLQDRNLIDPALAEQFDSALRKYRALRDQISSAQIDLDTAQLAFKHRYNIVAPAEVPTKAAKPKVGAIIGGGIFAALLLAIAVAIGAELRTDRIQQQWQVRQIALPVLADLRFPPEAGE